MNKVLALAALVLTLCACGVPQARHAAPSPGNGRAGEIVPGESQARGRIVYRIDTEQSELRVLVYRAGPLARFGHNHVMVNGKLSGSITLAEPTENSAFSLDVPVSGFSVDDSEMRREEGDEFPGDIPDDAKSGTLHNMLSAAVLDAAEFPDIIVTGTGMATAAGATASTDVAKTMTARVTLRVAGHESTVDIPFDLENDSRHLSARGSVQLSQTALGLTPYSLMLGALQVQDAMTLKFRIVASRSE